MNKYIYLILSFLIPYMFGWFNGMMVTDAAYVRDNTHCSHLERTVDLLWFIPYTVSVNKQYE